MLGGCSVDQNCVDKLEDALTAGITEGRRTQKIGTTSLNLVDIPGKLRDNITLEKGDKNS